MAESSDKPMVLTDLPAEILLRILESCPDLPSLLKTCQSHPQFRTLYKDHEATIVTQVLMNETSGAVYPHARAALLADELTLPNLPLIEPRDLNRHVRRITELRDRETPTKLTLAKAMSLSQRHRKVTELANAFFKTCDIWNEGERVDTRGRPKYRRTRRNQIFFPLADSLRLRGPSKSERIRVQQAIYLFEILRCLCKKMHIDPGMDDQYYEDYEISVEELQNALINDVLAPWEMHQVLAIQAFFRRSISYYGDRGSERIIPTLLSNGVDFLHQTICCTGFGDRDEFLEPYESRALQVPMSALGIILSRGCEEVWTRREADNAERYTPFADNEDADGIAIWKKMEHEVVLERSFLADRERAWFGVFSLELPLTEGRLDLWSAALWDEDRWDGDIVPTLRSWDDICWFEVRTHPDYYARGFRDSLEQQILPAWMANETIQG